MTINQITKYVLACLITCVAMAAAVLGAPLIDVIKYDARIEPALANRSLTGTVAVEFRSLTNALNQIELNDGSLVIDDVLDQGGHRLTFINGGGILKINLLRGIAAGKAGRIEITYHGAPKYGMRFFPDEKQVYTVFSTSQWMPCIDAPSDRARLRMTLTLPAGFKVVGNGTNTSNKNLPGDKKLSVWEQTEPVPSYIFGFAAGDYHEVSTIHRGVTLRYLYSSKFQQAEIERIFRDTADILDFFQDRSGVKYPYLVYTQVLAAGGPEQEMAGFTAMDEPYGQGVLQDERENWLGAHEFAHQWWGNQVTNIDWTHFWLNEGFANFLVAAYKEHRFGRDEYLKEIDKLRTRYEKVRDAGKDKPLVFPDWDHPTREDRTIVYSKGGYVLHLLREEMGDNLFWEGIKSYTRTNWGRSVVTIDFQHAMEKVAKRSLSTFFDKWVYH